MNRIKVTRGDRNKSGDGKTEAQSSEERSEVPKIRPAVISSKKPSSSKRNHHKSSKIWGKRS